MTINELNELLEAASDNGRLTLNETLAEGVFACLFPSLGGNSLTLVSCRVQKKEQELFIYGQGIPAFFHTEQPFQIMIYIKVQEDSFYFEVTCTLIKPQTVHELFGDLPDNIMKLDNSQVLTSCAAYPLIFENEMFGFSVKEGEINAQPFAFSGKITIPSDTDGWKDYETIIKGTNEAMGKVRFDASQDKHPAQLEFAIAMTGMNYQYHNLTVSNLMLQFKSHVKKTNLFFESTILSETTLLLNIVIADLQQMFQFRSELFLEENEWVVSILFDPVLTPASLVNLLVSFFSAGSWNFYIPDKFPAVNLFGLKELALYFDRTEGNTLVPAKLSSLYAAIGLNKGGWTPPIPYVSIEDLIMVWGFHMEKGQEALSADQTLQMRRMEGALITGHVKGTVKFSWEKKNKKEKEKQKNKNYELSITVSGALPDFDVRGKIEFSEQDDEESVSLDDFSSYFGFQAPTDSKLLLGALSICASYKTRSCYIELEIPQAWSFSLLGTPISFQDIGAQLFVYPDGKDFMLEGAIEFKAKTPFALYLRAEYAESVWFFSGGISYGVVSISDLLEGIFHTNVPNSDDELFSLELTKLHVEFVKADNGRFYINAALAMKWQTSIFDTPMALEGEVELEKKKQLEGKVNVTFSVNRFFISATYLFMQSEKQFVFRIQWKNLYLKAVYSNETDQQQKKHELLTLSLGGMTLGDVVEAFVNLINPNLHFSLPSPWDILNKISFERFLLKFDMTDKITYFTYRADLNIAGLVQVDEIGLRYQGGIQESSLKFVITGRFLEKEYDLTDPLTWDALKESPPRTPGKGEELFNIHYVGIGCSFSNEEMKSADSVAEAIHALEKAMLPLEEGQQPALSYDESVNWVFGTHFTILGAIDAQIVFQDPALYGARLQIGSSDNSFLAAFVGFSMELLYKKVTEDIGMFRATIQMPERFRRFDLGWCSFQLGEISLELYTNGNFKIDLGFPHNRDFTRSFVIEAGIYTGRGGLYFGVLNGQTCDQVPDIVNGTFSPVITIGVGLSIGLGRSFDIGIVKGGVSLEAVGIFEGVFGIFHPDEKGKSEAIYYYARATVGIVGLLYLDVDFKIICISASVRVAAMATVTLEAYQPLLLGVSLDLKVAASIKILFIKIKFSFHFHCEASFTIGSASMPPWEVRGGDNRMLMTEKFRHRYQLRTGTIRQRYQLITEKKKSSLQQSEAKIITVYLLPGYTTKQTGNAPVYGVVFSLFAPLDEKGENSAFSDFLSGVVEYLFERLGSPSRLTNDILMEFLESLDEDSTDYWEELQTSFIFHITGDTKAENADEKKGAFLPMLPCIVLEFVTYNESGQAVASQKIDYASVQPVDAGYLKKLRSYIQSLNPNPKETTSCKDTEEKVLSMPHFIFNDYIRMIFRIYLQESLERLKKQPFAYEAQTLLEVCEAFNESADGVYAVFRLPGREDDTEDITISPMQILADNQDWKFKQDSLVLSSYSYTIANTDTLMGLSKKFDIETTILLEELKTLPRLFAKNATLSFSNYTFQNRTDSGALSLLEVAVVFYVRFYHSVLDYEKLQGDIQRANPAYGAEDVLPFGQNVDISTVRGMEERTSWTAFYGDTYGLLAQYIVLLNDWKQNQNFITFLNKLKQINKIDETQTMNSYQIAGDSISLNGDRTLKDTLLRLYPDKEIEKDNSGPIEVLNAAVLRPLALITLRDAKISGLSGKSVSEVKKYFGVDEEALAEAGQAISGLMESDMIYSFSLPVLTDAHFLELANEQDIIEKIANMLSRFFMQGLRYPKSEGDEMEALFALTNQQLSIDVDQNAKEDYLRYEASFNIVSQAKTDFALYSMRVQDGSVQKDDEIQQLTLSFYNEDLKKELPDSSLTLDFKSPLAQMPLFGKTIRTYDVSHTFQYTTMQAESADLLNGETENSYNLSMFSETFLNRKTKALSKYALYAAGEGKPNGTILTTDTYSYLSSFSMELRKTKVDACYEIAQIGQDERQLLSHIKNFSISSIRVAYGAYETAELPVGLLEFSASENGAYLIKTNLSLENHSGRQQVFELMNEKESNDNLYFASLGQSSDFVKLLWEAGEISQGGYYLTLKDQDGQTLPDDVFNEQEIGKVWLLISFWSLTDESVINSVLTYNEAAAGKQLYFAWADESNIPEEEKDTAQILQPSDTGFAFQIAAASEEWEQQKESYKQWLLRRLYHIASYSIAENEFYNSSQSSLPLLPSGEEKTEIYAYSQVIPAAKLLKQQSENPYAAIGKPLAMKLQFRDIFGNQDQSNENSLELTPVYHDVLLNLNVISGLRSFYAIEENRFVLYLLADLDKLWQSDIQRGQKLQEQSALLKKFWYQSENVTAKISTTLTGQEETIGLSALRTFVNQVYKLLNWAIQAEECMLEGETLDKCRGNIVFSYDELGSLNLSVPVADIFSADKLKIPQFYVWAQGDVLNQLVEQQCLQFKDFTLPDNLQLEVSTDIYVKVKTQTAVVGEQETIEQLGIRLQTSLASLGDCNKDAEGILVYGTVFEMQGYEVEVPEDDTITLQDVCDTFEDSFDISDVTPQALLVQKEKESIFKKGANLTYDSIRPENGTTLADLADGDINEFLQNNSNTVNLFTAGSSILLTDSISLDPKDFTLDEISLAYGVKAGCLLSYNKGLSLKQPEALKLPAHFLPKDISDDIKSLLLEQREEAYSFAEVSTLLQNQEQNVDVEAFWNLNARFLNLLKQDVSFEIWDKMYTIVKQNTIEDLFFLIQEQEAIEGKTVSFVEIYEQLKGVKLFLPGIKFIIPFAKTSGASFTLSQDYKEKNDAVASLKTELILERTENLPADCNLDIRRSVTALAPVYIDKDRRKQLVDFAKAVESALPGIKLGESGDDQELSVVTFGGKILPYVEVIPWDSLYQDKKGPRMLGLRPLSQTLVTSGAYVNVDLESWAIEFLTDFDALLTPEYMTRAYEAGAYTSLQSLLDQKENLAVAISGGLAPILTELSATDEKEQQERKSAMESAAESLKNQLRVSLKQGYGDNVILQYKKKGSESSESAKYRLVGNAAGGEMTEQAVDGIVTGKIRADSPKDFVNLTLRPKAQTVSHIDKLTLSYLFKEMEYNIQKDESSRYESSQWLTFLRPFEGTDSGVDLIKTEFSSDLPIPLPVRGYPTVPVCQKQEINYEINTAYPIQFTKNVCACLAGVNTVRHNAGRPFSQYLLDNNLKAEKSLLDWSYCIRYVHQTVPQDTICFDFQLKNTLQAGDNVPTIFDSLADYHTQKEALWLSLSSSDDAVFTKALEDFSSTATAIAQDWKGHFEGQKDLFALQNFSVNMDVIMELAVSFEELEEGGIQIYLQALKLTKPDELPVPTISLCKNELCLETFNYEEEKKRYHLQLKEKQDFSKGMELQISITGLMLYKYQEAATSIKVKRNKDLFPNHEDAVNPAFIYETSWTSFAQNLTAFVQYNGAIDLSSETDGDPDFAAALKKVLEEFLLVKDYQVKICFEVGYGYYIGATEDGREVILPICYYPKADYQEEEISKLAGSLLQWYKDVKPNDNGRFITLHVSVYGSSFDNREERMLLDLADVRVKI